VHLDATVTNVRTDGDVVVVLEDGTRVAGELLLVTTGRRPTPTTSVRGLGCALSQPWSNGGYSDSICSMVRSTYEMSTLLECGTALRKIGIGARSMEDVASEVVTILRNRFIDKETGNSALPLVRFYVTQRCRELEPALQDFALAAGSDTFANQDVVCLALLATCGEEPAWNDRTMSQSHKAIPLPSIEALHRSPMVAQLVRQLGVDPQSIIEPDPALFHDLGERTYNVFYVPEARNSEYVPAQNDFVIPYGIRSVVGFGGVLPDGTLFATIMFSSVPVPPSAIEAFSAIALSVKISLLPQVGREIFRGWKGAARQPGALAALRTAADDSRITALSQLLDVRAAVVEQEAMRLELAIKDAEDRANQLARSQAALAASEARQKAIIEGALDCIIGMDAAGRITDFNRAAEDTFGFHREDVIGQLLSEVLLPPSMRERHRHGLTNFLQSGEGPILGRRIETSALRSDGSEFPVELIVTQVADVDPPMFNGYLHDITARRKAADELAAGRERLVHIARTLQSTFLPPSLPYIDGMELAATYRAFGDGYEVGGDFYDVFETGDGKWTLVLGDVCGKGSEAAVITALARYSIRAAAVRSADPADVLAYLNAEIYRQYPSQFCTAAVATIHARSGTVQLALGGHPHPLLLGRDGTVSPVGTAGRLVGPFEEWIGTTTLIELAPGDALLFYSDGVTEARFGDQQFGDEGLRTTLATARGTDTWNIVNLVESGVLDFAGGLTDDLALLALKRSESS
jgi:PAS domain S-box-containing protein